ncbi:DNA/RNA polymerases superfamily protein [Gossypium australe]|uniref:DNA/RNA polymerases superfamily protein n=1 Tax=Gossypium australe TaxID=47621 RepID=A0A5B6UYI5_9ROSI|nr:DNA/RNA polymerases superfamily protein [Gossypium australe]
MDRNVEFRYKNKLVETDLIRETEDKVRVIQDYLKATSNHKKSYAELKKKDMEFSIGDRVFLNVLRFSKKEKLSPRFIGSYKIIKRIGPVAYKLALPLKLEKVHHIFHVSMLRWYRSDPLHVISPNDIELQPDMSY